MPIFKIDLVSMKPELYGGEQEGERVQKEIPSNEINTACEIKNTPHHKQIIKARNLFYTQYKKRFQDSVTHVLDKFDLDRAEEVKFNGYWQQSL